MAVDLRRLRPAELCRLINSTPLGTVLTEGLLRKHRNHAGLQIGDLQHVDLLRYTAWLAVQRHYVQRKARAEAHDRHRAASRERNAKASVEGRNTSGLPPVVDPERKDRAKWDFRFFCESYFPLTFTLPWSDDHLKIIAKIEQAVLHGGLFAMAMPRGSGKTTICECACIWAILYGHHKFVALIGSDESHAADMLASIKMELECNDLLHGAFREATLLIRNLDGIVNRCAGQLYDYKRTHIRWTANQIVLPMVPDSAASGAIIQVAGITGRIRGMKYKRADGETVRPTLVVIDDPQTDESARSATQCATRESILAGAVLGLAGPGKKISGIMPCTVIRPGDMADRILDRDKHPEWNGERTKMVYAWPTATKLWETYAQLRADGLRAGRGIADATEFYRLHQAEMDAGARVAWPARFNCDELSAIQHAMNLRLHDEAAFFAEYQNEPLQTVVQEHEELGVDQIAGKVNRLKRGVVPLGCNYVTAFIDVQAALLYFAVVAWEEAFTGYVIDYGTYPDQQKSYFRLRDARPTLQQIMRGAGLEGAIYAGLDALTQRILGREWHREDGATLRIERCLIDANWGQSTDVIYQFCRQSAYAGVVMPSHGKFVGASSVPLSEYRRKPGDRVGLNWRMPGVQGQRMVRYVLFDSNYWKTFIHARLATAMGDKGCLSLFGDRPEQHRLFAEHIYSEYRVPTQGRGRHVDEWKLRPEHFDNHWLDCLVGCAVAASIQGVSLHSNERRAPRATVRLSDLQRGRR